MFNKFIIALLILVASPDWYLYTSQKLNFSILFPFKPTVQIKKIQTDLGTIGQTTAFIRNQDSSAIEYQVLVSEYTPELFDSPETDSLKQLIQSTLVEEMETYLKGQIIYENSAEFKGMPCYWFLIKYSKSKSLKSCLIWDQTNLICIIHYSDYDQRLSIESDRFFNSFMLLSKK